MPAVFAVVEVPRVVTYRGREEREGVDFHVRDADDVTHATCDTREAAERVARDLAERVARDLAEREAEST